jgi:hypothetical protein
MNTATAAQSKVILDAIKAGIANTAHHTCYGGCARIYLKEGSLLTIDELFSLSKAEQKKAKKARQKDVKIAMNYLELFGKGKTIGGKVYMGYDNNDKVTYSKAVNIASALKEVGVNLSVDGIED